MGYEPTLQDPLSLLPILGAVFVLGLIWVAVKYIFKIAMKVFAIGCIAIVILGGIMLAAGWLLPEGVF